MIADIIEFPGGAETGAIPSSPLDEVAALAKVVGGGANAGSMLAKLTPRLFWDYRWQAIHGELVGMKDTGQPVTHKSLMDRVKASTDEVVKALIGEAQFLPDHKSVEKFDVILHRLTEIADQRDAVIASDERQTREQGPCRANVPEVGATRGSNGIQCLPDGSDAHRASRFVGRFSELLRFVPEWDRWLVFEGGRWKTRDDGGLIRFSCQLSGEILASASSIVGDSRQVQDEVKRLTAEAGNYAGSAKVFSMATFAKADHRVIIRPEDADADPWIVGAPNACLDLRTGNVIEHSPSRLVTRFLGCDIDPKATAPTWAAFLDRVVPDTEVRHWLQKAAGYSLSGLTQEHHFCFLYGNGANGKSTFLETLSAALGDYAGRAAESLLYANERGATPPDVIAEIAGVRLLVGAETKEGARLNEGTVKDLTGGDTLRGARKYEHGFKFRPVAKLWVAGNHRPAIQGADHGIWRRVRLIGFPVEIPLEAQDAELGNKLLAELPGVINWMAEGFRNWQREGLRPPESVQAAVAEYRSDEDVLGDFLDQRIEAFTWGSIPMSELYKQYQRWAEESGIRSPLSDKMLARRLRDRRWQDGKGTAGQRVWRGVKFKETP